MPFNLIPIAIILVSLAILVSLLLKKFSSLSMIDVSTIAEERDLQVKEKIIQERIERYFKKVFQRMAPWLTRLLTRWQKSFRNLYRRIQLLERKLEEKKKSHSKKDIMSQERRLQEMLAQAESLFEEKKLKEAEEEYIEVIASDPKNCSAYRGLIEIYADQNDDEKVRETSRYLLRILEDEKEKAELHYRLGEWYHEKKEYLSALEHFQKALSLVENNPKYLDFLLDTSILLEDKELAVETFERLHTANPENQKLSEYKERIEKLIIRKGSEEKTRG